ncbi:hypothetical protein [uncultured Phycicoccus sp.]|uniref:hypothetical protein n=1 Tax=uncultured Phycicoccus sp. TaxID=661422 RepID=UPI002631BC2A|nr:hypothetical protein [uncultured Phycicoccus sp.]
MEYQKSTRVSLKSHAEFNEKWLQQQITSDVTLLGLGELDVKDVERRQPRSGRLDVLLFDPETSTRYEVELQLGATDESHIIRTLEYWDNERRRFPQYEHIAVIVAEEITGRFLNVINLFNQAIPLIAVQMSALEVNGVLTLHSTKVLDLALPAPEEEDEPGQDTDRSYWQSRSSAEIVNMADRLLEVVNEQGPGLSLKYNKNYIGLQRDGVPDNFVSFRPRKEHLIWEVRIERDEELDARLEESGLNVMSYNKRWRQYRLHLVPGDLKSHGELIVDLVRRARGLPETTVADHG